MRGGLESELKIKKIVEKFNTNPSAINQFSRTDLQRSGYPKQICKRRLGFIRDVAVN